MLSITHLIVVSGGYFEEKEQTSEVCLQCHWNWKFSSFDGREGSKHNNTSFVGLANMFMTQVDFWKAHDRVE